MMKLSGGFVLIVISIMKHDSKDSAHRIMPLLTPILTEKVSKLAIKYYSDNTN